MGVAATERERPLLADLVTRTRRGTTLPLEARRPGPCGQHVADRHTEEPCESDGPVSSDRAPEVGPQAAMSFEEAMTRARADHVIVDTFHQPGNDYRTEHRCTCGLFVFATNWERHVIAAADALRDGFRLDGSDVLYVKRVPL